MTLICLLIKYPKQTIHLVWTVHDFYDLLRMGTNRWIVFTRKCLEKRVVFSHRGKVTLRRNEDSSKENLKSIRMRNFKVEKEGSLKMSD